MKHRIVAVLFLAAVATGMIFAQQPAVPAPDAPPVKRGMHREAIMNELNLNDQQQSQIEKLRTPFQKAQEQLHSKVRLNRLDLRDLLNAEKIDRGAIEKNMKATSDLQYQLKIGALDHMLSVREILTPEQRKIWKKHMAALAADVEGRRMGRTGGMGRGPRP